MRKTKAVMDIPVCLELLIEEVIKIAMYQFLL